MLRLTCNSLVQHSFHAVALRVSPRLAVHASALASQAVPRVNKNSTHPKKAAKLAAQEFSRNTGSTAAACFNVNFSTSSQIPALPLLITSPWEAREYSSQCTSVWEELGLLAKLKASAVRKEHSVQLHESLKQLIRHFWNAFSVAVEMPAEQWRDAWLFDNPLYLGNYEELVAQAEARGGTWTTSQARSWLLNDSMESKMVLRKMGLTAEELSEYQIDHILPENGKAGASHPYNFCLMPKGKNASFGNRTTAEKCWYVGLGVTLRVISFHCGMLKLSTGCSDPSAA